MPRPWRRDHPRPQPRRGTGSRSILSPTPSWGNFERESGEDGERFVWLPDQVAETMRLRGEPLWATHFDSCSALDHPDDTKPF